MARTAPVPNIPPIPGMCPSIAVMGGGAGGGGGSGDGAGDGDGNGPADGNGAGDGANGDGSGAGQCGNGSPGACTNCGHNVAAGDPMDASTGEVFTVSLTDLFLSGPIHLDLRRSYRSTARKRDVGLGFGWAHTFAWSIVCDRHDYIVSQPFAGKVRFSKSEASTLARGDGGWTMYPAGPLFRVDTNDDFTHVFEPVDATRERYRLVRVEHVSRNAFALEYDGQGTLMAIRDAAGRRIDVRSNSEKRISELTVTDPASGQFIRFASYSYDDRGNLVGVVDADGDAYHFEYDDSHRMTLQRYPNGLRIHYLYDAQGRCVESWGDREDGVEQALAPDLPKVLSDGKTPVRGLYHTKLELGADGFSEVVDTLGIRRLFREKDAGIVSKAIAGDGGVTTRSLDDFGLVKAKMDATGGVYSYQWDQRGRLLREVDPLGNTFTIGRDHAGRVVANIDQEGAAMQCHRDAWGNITTILDPRNGVTSYTYDERSLMTSRTEPNGARTVFASDPHGNMASATFPDGATWRWVFDYWGRCVQRTDARGNSERYLRSPGGKVLRMVRADGTEAHYVFGPLSKLTTLSRPAGVTTFSYGGLGWLIGVTQPNGDSARFLYDYAGRCVRIENEKGEPLLLERGREGEVVTQIGFDGATLHVAYDKVGRIRKWSRDSGWLTFERDAAGRVIGTDSDTGATESFRLNGRGDHIGAATEGTRVELARDLPGTCVGEIQTAAGTSNAVTITRDVMGAVTELTSSLGAQQRFERDAMSRVARAHLDGTTVSVERDAGGLITRRWLSNRVAIEHSYDARMRLVSTQLRRPPETTTVAAGEPRWLGEEATGVILARSYTYTPSGEIATVADRDEGSTTYTYDPRGRLLTRRRERDDSIESFGYDPAGNVFEAGSARARSYGPGNRLLELNGTRYEWSKGGFLSAMHLPDGGSYRFTWTAQRFLGAVDLPDNGRLELAYDPFGRRLSKRVFAKKAGRRQLVRTVAYVWAEERVLQEREVDVATGTVRVRTYAYDDNAAFPYAHRDVRSTRETQTESAWVFYISDGMGTPEVLVDAEGRVLGRIDRTSWGRATLRAGSTCGTDARFPGQFEDVETGLHYNRFRFYDPRSGRYISPDPLGVDVGLNFYRYCPNPIGWCDPWGLSHTTSCTVETADNEVWRPDSTAVTNTPRRGEGARTNAGGTPLAGFSSGNDPVVPGATRVRPTSGSLPPPGDPPSPHGGMENGHSERHSIEWAERTLGRDRLRGSTMRLGGQLPPCPRCHQAMQEFAARNNSTVHYNYPVNNNVTYDGTRPDANSGNPARAPFTSSGAGYHNMLMDTYRDAEAMGVPFGHESGSTYNPETMMHGGYTSYTNTDGSLTSAYMMASRDQADAGHGPGAMQADNPNARGAHRGAGGDAFNEENAAIPGSGGGGG